MREAAERIWRAVEKKEKIGVFGDYDADGVTATFLVFTFLQSLGAPVVYLLPEREENGYGLCASAVQFFQQEGVTLVITVDTGITAFAEAEQLAALGIDLIVTDHHQPRDTLPAAVAVVDPHREDDGYPFRELAGVGVAFKLLCAVAEGRAEELLAMYADVLALGTIADMCSVFDENRVFIRAGLRKMQQNPNEGLRALLEKSGLAKKKIGVSQVAFGLAPRINAAGRVSSPVKALRLLLETQHDRALSAAQVLCEENLYRRELEMQIAEQIEREAEAHPACLEDSILVLAGEGWHPGVLGIAAARVARRYRKPVVLLCIEGETARGSARSDGSLDILQAIAQCSDQLTTFGGHSQAAGLQLPTDQIEAFRRKINQYAQTQTPAPAVLELDGCLSAGEATLALAKELQRLEPFGTGNPQPLLACVQMTLRAATPVGGGKHLRLTLADATGQVQCMAFGVTPAQFAFAPGDKVDVAYRLETNEWMGCESVALILQEIRAAQPEEDVQGRLRQLLHGAREPAQEELPDRADFVFVYRLLSRADRQTYDLLALSRRLQAGGKDISAVKLGIILEVFREVGLLTVQFEETAVVVTPCRAAGKVSLQEAATAKRFGLMLDKKEG